MDKFDIYRDIAKRTDGDLYIGVVGPVRTGKSTFINKFMEYIVTPNISSKNKRQVAIDEMPQSGEGKTLTTTEPKFVPGESVKISLKGKSQAKVRLIDCVGYLVDGVIGDKEDGKDRLVKTPWNNQPIPFEKAAEIGTEKVIKEHATIGVVVTTDGSIVDIPRENYEKAEERVISEMRESKKPFIIVLNCKNPKSESARSLANKLTEKYGVKVIAINVLETNEEELTDILSNLLMEFPMKCFDITLPKWIQILPPESRIISNICEKVKEIAPCVICMKHYKLIEDVLKEVDGVKQNVESKCLLGEGKIEYKVDVDNSLFYELLSEMSGEEIKDEFCLMKYVKELALAKQSYEKTKNALSEVYENGYGIVVPTDRDMVLQNPEVVKQGGRYGVKIKATTECMHFIKINLDAEVTPISGTQKQCTDFAEFIQKEYEENPEKVWNTNVFGKKLSTLVSDEIISKINSMKTETKNKMRKTVTRIVNEGKGGVICILL
ncbi:MAG: stage IV sporulation protein A [Clostridia bacterium]|nr:stage IV sporulation protein A [Clostridia bacterium]